MAERVIVISGPSGAGKSTLITKLLSAHPGRFKMSISHTTRQPRPGETDGVEYHFVTREEFMQLVEQDGFIEWTSSYTNLYGTSVKAVEDACSEPGVQCIVDIDSIGVGNFKARCAHLNGLYIFICPPSIDVLTSRLTNRRTDGEDALRRRLAQSQAEIDYAKTGVYDIIIVNDDLDRAYNLLLNVIASDLQSGDDPAHLKLF